MAAMHNLCSFNNLFFGRFVFDRCWMGFFTIGFAATISFVMHPEKHCGYRYHEQLRMFAQKERVTCHEASNTEAR